MILFFTNIYKKIFKYKNFFFIIFLVLFFPINISVLDNLDANLSDQDTITEDKTSSKFLKYAVIFGCTTLFLFFFFEGFGYCDSFFNYFKDPVDIDYKYPNDGKIRPPQNPVTKPMYDYFVIPGKPYFINGELNFPLLNKDIITYSNMEIVRTPGVAIAPIYVKWLEICYGYDLSQETVDNLEVHRRLTNETATIQTLYKFVKRYYKDDLWPNRRILSWWPWPNQWAYYEGKDFYDCRIYPGIYTGWWDIITKFE